MKLKLRLQHLLGDKAEQRGLIAEIQKATRLERHTISAMLHSSVKYVSLDALGKICDYLVHHQGVDAARLPGDLFVLEPDGFWTMLADLKRTEFCLATRSHPDWPERDHIMADDAHLQAMIVSRISSHVAPPKAELPANDALGHERSWQHLVPAPRPIRSKDGVVLRTLEGGREDARAIFRKFRKGARPGSLVAIGSIKVQNILEYMLADTFAATPFASEDGVAEPHDRSCPIYFRYKTTDVAPVSLCGGNTLSQTYAPTQPGIYYETSGGHWECCPTTKATHDSGFVFYAYRPNVDQLRLACGGFTGAATRMLSIAFDQIASACWEPQYMTSDLLVGMFVIAFDIRGRTSTKQRDPRAARFDFTVIPLPVEAVAPRVKRRRRAASGGKPASTAAD
ncbi:MAG: helix-turn-helix transcriptional regulator [Planctomycetes bacterium]|nr:helix-turn-helix transcriptional regulator [Planctomycetota bacterium]